MTVFKTYLKILKKNKLVVIMYAIILLVFTVFSSNNGNPTETFLQEKPEIAIINNDTNSAIINNFINYVSNNANIVEIENNIDDALFYGEVQGIVYIYSGYTEDYINNKEKPMDVKLATNSNSTYVSMLLEKYFKIADITNDNLKDVDTIIETINDSLEYDITVKMDSKLDVSTLSKASYYYNFANYSLLAICIYIIATVMNTFNNKKIKMRNLISSKPINTFTKELYLSNLLFSLIVWAFIVIVSFFVVGNTMFTLNGLLLILNSLIFTICALSIGFLIGNIIKNKDALSGIMNVVSLGSSFLCGCFLPIEFMPDYVVKFSKLLPSYWYIKNNNFIKTIEVLNEDIIRELLFNIGIIIIFIIAYIILTLFYNKKTRKI